MLDKIAKVAAALIAVLFVACAACYANNQIDPAQYPETITVMAESKETATKDLGLDCRRPMISTTSGSDWSRYRLTGDA